jgi:Zn-dependent protease
MFSINPSDPIQVFLTILGVLLVLGVVISVHEASHAFVANLLGDPTARLMGRMSLNPFVHVDPIGTVIVPMVLMMLNAPVFGWAKPTPVNPLNLHQPRRDMALVSLAGPASNFALAIVFSIVFRIFPNQIVLGLIVVNLVLGIFNLIPIPPLDGYKVVLGILPKDLALRFSVLESYGPIILLVFLLFFFQIFSGFIGTILSFLLTFLTGSSH